MFSTGSKYFFGITFLGAVSFAIYMLLIGESAIGATALFGLVGATGLLTALVLSTRDGSKDEEGIAASTAAPTASILPLIGAIGAALLLVGTITSPLVTLFGIIALLAALIAPRRADAQAASYSVEPGVHCGGTSLNPLEDGSPYPLVGAELSECTEP